MVEDVVVQPWLTVVETRAYLARAEKLLSREERDAVVKMLAADPLCGELMVGTGGVRKARFAMEGRGQSGGARVVYFFFNDGAPVFLLAVFGKNEKANLSKSERNQLAKLVQVLKEQLRRG
jgi:hypothetical protein